MKFNLFRAVYKKEIAKIVYRITRKQKSEYIRASKKKLKALAELISIEREGLPKHLVCKKLPEDLGRGIFLHPLAKPILKGEIIAPYSGEISLLPQTLPDDSAYAFAPLSDILITKEEHRSLGSSLPYHPKRLYWLNIDAEKKGNFTRFINHSEKPNVIAELFSIPPNSFGLEPVPIEVLYLAKKRIEPGEQLLINYEGEDKSYWSAIGIKPLRVTPRTFRIDSSLKVISHRRSR